MSMCTRREFVAVGAATCFASVGFVHRSLVLAQQEKPGPVDVGSVEDFKKDGAVDTWTPKHRFFVVRQNDRLFAVSAICSHRGGTLRAENDEGRLFCPKHEGTFELSGKLRGGKPQKSVPHLAIKLDDRKHVIVDTSKEIEEKDWDNPGNFLKLG